MIELKLQILITNILSEKFKTSDFSDIDDESWHKLFDFAKKQGLSILIFDILMRNRIIIPEDIRDTMKNICYSACIADVKRKKQLKEIIRLFNDNNIDHILLKGAALISTVYKHSSICRSMCDIDILVHKEDADKAYLLLQKKGYRSLISIDEEIDKYKAGFAHHYPALKKTGCLMIELHTRLSDYFNANIEKIWNRAEAIDIDNMKSRIMCPEDLIMHIILHAYLHHKIPEDNALVKLYDIYLLLKNEDINWDILRYSTSNLEYSNSKCLYIALYLIEKLFNAKVNIEFMSSIAPGKLPERILGTIQESLFSDFYDMDQSLYKLGMNIPCTRKDWRVLLKQLFFSPSKMALHGKALYGNGEISFRILSFLYIKRTLTLIIRYVRAFIKYLTIQKNAVKSVKSGNAAAEFKHWLSE